MEKCRYYNDHHTAVTLMIDDILPGAVTFDGEVAPWNDWGYGGREDNSLFKHLENNLLSRFPHVKGTFFIAAKSFDSLKLQTGYFLRFRKENDFFKRFLKDVASYFDVGFHGIYHGKFLDINKPTFRNNWLQEFEYLSIQDISWLKEEILKFENEFEIKMTGGKYPGYKKNQDSEKILETLGFKWWCSSSKMINKKSPENHHTYFGAKNNILDLPTNLNGNVFNYKIFPNSMKGQIKFFKTKWERYKTERYIHYLYTNRIPITVQEHFQNQHIDGRRISPNLYDDGYSLDKIFSLLRGSDIWYANCSELSQYLESYDQSEIIHNNEGQYLLSYHGTWEKPLLSIRSKSPFILDLSSGEQITGLFRNGFWIYNRLLPGKYKEVSSTY